jgi:hypothetical protein
MDSVQVRRRLLQRYGIRVEEEMCAYLLRRLAEPGGRAIAVIGGNARTGVPMRQVIEPAALASDRSQPASGT